MLRSETMKTFQIRTLVRQELAGATQTAMTIRDIASAIGVDLTRSHMVTIGKVMRELGWVVERTQVDGRSRKVYLSPDFYK